MLHHRAGALALPIAGHEVLVLAARRAAYAGEFDHALDLWLWAAHIDPEAVDVREPHRSPAVLGIILGSALRQGDAAAAGRAQALIAELPKNGHAPAQAFDQALARASACPVWWPGHHEDETIGWSKRARAAMVAVAAEQATPDGPCRGVTERLSILLTASDLPPEARIVNCVGRSRCSTPR